MIRDAEFIPSPNYDERPIAAEVNLLVIHNISLPPGEFAGDAVTQFFQNRLDPRSHPYFETICHIKVSSHLFIRRDGYLVQYVPFDKRAWHAGESTYNGRENCNDYSIGIELEGADDIPYTSEQYKKLRKVTGEIIQQFPAIHAGSIVGHSDISPQRKTDPGPAFDWDFYLKGL